MKSKIGKKRTARNQLATVIIGISFGVVIIAFFSARYYYSIKTLKKEIPASAAPTTEVEAGEPVPPVLSGRQSYKLITNETPRFTEASIEPLDAPRGARQVITAKVESPSPVKSVSVAVITDSGEKNVNMRLTQGTEYNGVWSESHTVNDTYEKTYRFRFTATDQYDSSTVTITSR